MSSKIKVDTIENVAGSGNVSLGSGHNLVVPGTLGVGETTPLGKLHIKSGDSGASSVNANANELVIENSDYTGITILGENESNICFGDNEDPDVGRIEYHHSDNSMRFRTNASDALRIDSSGNVGIGTTSPEAQTHVAKAVSAGSDNLALRIQNPTNASDARVGIAFHVNAVTGSGWDGAFIQSANSGSDNGDLRFGSVTNNTLSERMRIDSSGKVGIGDSSPLGNKVHIRTGGSASSVNATAGLVLEDDDSTRCDLQFIGPDGTFQSILFGDVSDDDIGKISYSHSGNNMRFTVNASERMRIDSSGNVGINSSNPTTPLFINKAVADHTSTAITLQNSQAGGYGGQIIFKSAQSNGNLLTAATIGTDGASAWNSTANTDSNLKFSVVGDGTLTERMRISSDGSTLFGCTSLPSASVVGSAFKKTLYDMELLLSTALTTGNNIVEFYNPNGRVGQIVTNGSSTAYQTSSDYRLKENVDYTFDATTRLKQLKPARFNFKTDADTTVDGFIAHEVSSVVPEAISGEKDATQDLGTITDEEGNIVKELVLESSKKEGETWTKTKTENVYQGIDQSKLVPLLVKTIQELEARITTLENA